MILNCRFRFSTIPCIFFLPNNESMSTFYKIATNIIRNKCSFHLTKIVILDQFKVFEPQLNRSILDGHHLSVHISKYYSHNTPCILWKLSLSQLIITRLATIDKNILVDEIHWNYISKDFIFLKCALLQITLNFR
jgi:hypothetical protein